VINKPPEHESDGSAYEKAKYQAPPALLVSHLGSAFYYIVCIALPRTAANGRSQEDGGDSYQGAAENPDQYLTAMRISGSWTFWRDGFESIG
jgi:hypothetical protein